MYERTTTYAFMITIHLSAWKLVWNDEARLVDDLGMRTFLDVNGLDIDGQCWLL
jgi:hypothetical protein